jgi:NAD(P)-dependent dehydrogenase (short-subunit alcohol dehydrogenase family)
LVNAIAPGPILPPLAASKKVKFEVQKQTPLKKWGGVVEIVKTVLFLLKTDFITGECIRVDGGRHLI